MLGLESYGSDSSDTEELPAQPAPTPAPAPKPAKAKKPVRIVVDAPKLSRPLEDDDEDKPAKKKPRLGSGAGASSLLAMLPAPKVAAAAPPKPERVLGGAGSGSGLAASRRATVEDAEDEGDNPAPDAATLLVPTSVKKAAAAAPAKPKEPARDFFSLGESSTARLPTLPTPSSNSSVQISSAPEIKEYEPPEPTPSDPYPGYYQMPNGQWGAYDPAYYQTFWDKWQRAAMPQQDEKGFEGVDQDGIQSVSAMDEMARARKDIESAKSLTRNIKTGPSAPNMNIAKAPARGLANQRHQLSTLLYAAYQNRDALEEKIAEGKRNRKEAGNKYGF